MSTAVLCGTRRRKLAIKFRLGAPLPVPRTIHRKRGMVSVVGSSERREIEVGVVRDPYRGFQVGQVVDRPLRGGRFTRDLVRVSSQLEVQRLAARRAERDEVRALRAALERDNAEAFAYLEGLAALDELDRAALDSALERTVELEEMPS